MLGFMAACKQYFGILPGESLLDFKKEVDALTDKDREDLAPALSKAIGDFVDPKRVKPAGT